MKQKFVNKKFRQDSLDVIRMANIVLEQYRANDIQLTLRQLYYQFIAQDLFPESWVDLETGTKNNQKNYKRLGSIISDARDAGLIDWSAIEDRGRVTMGNTHWENGGHIIKAAASQFRLDRWANQPYHIEVLVEKDAATSVLLPTCQELDINFTANKGYGSSSLLYTMGRRIEQKHLDRKSILVLYCGDHDPSGLDMTRDVEERLSLYSGRIPIEVVRLALNYDQIELWNPPENPTKDKDPRSKDYVDQFGEVCYELDAVEPLTLRQLVEDEVLSRRDSELWKETLEREHATLKKLAEFAETFEEEDNEEGDEE